jgi:hypothetical protein
MQDTPKEAVAGDKAARDLMLSELLQVCTPAPWTVAMRNGHNANMVFCRDGDSAFEDSPICTVFGIAQNHHIDEMTVRDELGLANAKLIAIAPTIAAELIKERAVNAKLLEALKELITPFGGALQSADAYKKAKAAIKQAEEL